MIGTRRRLWTLLAGGILAALTQLPAHAQEDLLRRLIITQDADYNGFDYQTLREVDRDTCEAACLNDNRCRAFTYNTQAQWCFLKSDFGALTFVPNAIAGRIVVGPALSESTTRLRESELTAFLALDFVDEARRLAGGLDNIFAPGNRSFSDLLSAAGAARSDDNPALAANLYGAALAIADEDVKVWLGFGRATLLRVGASASERAEIRTRATSAAINAFLRSESDNDRASALVLLGAALELRGLWRPAIKAYRASLDLVQDELVAANLETLVAEHGFRILSHEVDVDAEAPRICIVFSDPLPVTRPGLADFISVEGASGLAIEPESGQICIDGVAHGGRYRIQVRAGLPAADGEVLANTAILEVFVPDRSPWAGFAGNAYVLPAGPQPTIPIQSVNTAAVEAEIHRIGDRSLAFALREGIFLRQLESYRAQEIASTSGQLIWTGIVETDGPLNELVTTAIPVTEALGEQLPGVYVITARLPDERRNYWDPDATNGLSFPILG